MSYCQGGLIFYFVFSTKTSLNACCSEGLIRTTHFSFYKMYIFFIKSIHLSYFIVALPHLHLWLSHFFTILTLLFSISSPQLFLFCLESTCSASSYWDFMLSQHFWNCASRACTYWNTAFALRCNVFFVTTSSMKVFLTVCDLHRPKVLLVSYFSRLSCPSTTSSDITKTFH